MAEIDYSNTSEEFDKWFGLSTPLFMVSVLSSYLLFVLKIGPSFMKNRPAYSLKTFILFYNMLQLLSCFYIIAQVLNITSTSIFYFWKCKLFEANTRQDYLFNRISYFTFWLKIVELTETVVFVLRKKNKQISNLHVFHHCSTVTLIYLLLKYYKGGAALYPLFLNTNVHIIMYSYYSAAAVCNEKTVKRLMPIKQSITTIQMIQFVLILLQAAVQWTTCEVPPLITIYYCVVVAVIFYGFYDFYKKSYTANRSKSKKSHT